MSKKWLKQFATLISTSYNSLVNLMLAVTTEMEKVLLLIPSREQFKKWTMPTRVSFIAAVFGIPIALIQSSLWIKDIYQWLQPAPLKLSAQDLLVIDKNPTKLDIVAVEKEKYSPTDEMVTISIKNSSNVTAKNVRVDFYNYHSKRFTNDDKYSNGINGSGVDISAGETRKYKIASLNTYKNFFNPEAPGAQLLNVSKKNQSATTPELQAIVCGKTNGEIAPCDFSYSTRSTVVDIKYGSIFGQRYHVLTQFYNEFLNGDVKFLPSLEAPLSED